MKNLKARLELVEERLQPELHDLANIDYKVVRLLSFRREWEERMRLFGEPRDWPENAGRWSEDAHPIQIVFDLFDEWLTESNEYAGIVVEPWYIGWTSEQRVRVSYLGSYHGPDCDFDYVANLNELVSLRKDWAKLRARYGHPRNWPENAGRWPADEHDGVVAAHLAGEWQNEYKRHTLRIAEGLGYFLVRNGPIDRLPDDQLVAQQFHGDLKRDAEYSPRGVA